MTLTKDQRRALKKVYDRGPLVADTCGLVSPRRDETPMTYHQFRRHVVCGWDCIMLHWQGMWLGVEADGYTHS